MEAEAALGRWMLRPTTEAEVEADVAETATKEATAVELPTSPRHMHSTCCPR